MRRLLRRALPPANIPACSWNCNPVSVTSPCRCTCATRPQSYGQRANLWSLGSCGSVSCLRRWRWWSGHGALRRVPCSGSSRVYALSLRTADSTMQTRHLLATMHSLGFLPRAKRPIGHRSVRRLKQCADADTQELVPATHEHLLAELERQLPEGPLYAPRMPPVALSNTTLAVPAGDMALYPALQLLTCAALAIASCWVLRCIRAATSM